MAKKGNILFEYSHFADVFSKELVAELSKHFDMNKHLIDSKPNKQPPYKLIYSQEPVDLKILKTYIKTNLANNFIRFFKFPAKALILFL